MSRIGNRRIDYKPKNDYYTPKWVFERIGLTFDLDVAAPEQGVAWVPAKKWFSLQDDGLSQLWEGLVWMNPPYSECVPWVAKFIEHGNGIALLPTSKAAWFKKLFDHPLVSIVHPADRVAFITPENEAKQIFMPTLLFAMGDVATEALRHSGLGRMR